MVMSGYTRGGVRLLVLLGRRIWMRSAARGSIGLLSIPRLSRPQIGLNARLPNRKDPKMTNEQWRTVRKRLVELLVAAITALVAALSTSCAVRWSSNSLELQPIGKWSYSSPEVTSISPPAGAVVTWTNLPPQNKADGQQQAPSAIR